MIITNSKDFMDYLKRRREEKPEDMNSPSVGGDMDNEDVVPPSHGHTTGDEDDDPYVENLEWGLANILENAIDKIGRATPPLGTHNKKVENNTQATLERRVESDPEKEDEVDPDKAKEQAAVDKAIIPVVKQVGALTKRVQDRMS
jgi:hypothetical protein